MTAEARTRRSRSGSICATVGAFLCLWSTLAGCLNPIPDEFPASQDNEPQPIVPSGEVTCRDNPYVVDCTGPRPDSSDNGNPNDGEGDPDYLPGGGEPNVNGNEEPRVPANPDAGLPDAGASADADVALP